MVKSMNDVCINRSNEDWNVNHTTVLYIRESNEIFQSLKARIRSIIQKCWSLLYRDELWQMCYYIPVKYNNDKKVHM